MNRINQNFDSESKIWIVVGLGFGDEGKGSIVDAIARHFGAQLIIRFNGGAQAAHHVITPNGITHCFSQLGSASFLTEVKTYLAAPVMVDPLALEREILVLQNKGLTGIAQRLMLDPECPVITPWHVWLNQITEITRGQYLHGTCGRGIGQLFNDLNNHQFTVLKIRNIVNTKELSRLLTAIRHEKIQQAEHLLLNHQDHPQLKQLFDAMMTPELINYLVTRYQAVICQSGLHITDSTIILDAINNHQGIIFEGAQGALLDMDFGFWPHVTPSRTTIHNAMELLNNLSNEYSPCKVGVSRAYLTRHGAGPLVTEDAQLAQLLPESHNTNDGWQGDMRCGWLDMVMLRYALAINQGVDRLVITCLDRLAAFNEYQIATHYHYCENKNNNFFSGSEKIIDNLMIPQQYGINLADRTAMLNRCTANYQHFLQWKTNLHQSHHQFITVIGEHLNKTVDWITLGSGNLIFNFN